MTKSAGCDTECSVGPPRRTWNARTSQRLATAFNIGSIARLTATAKVWHRHRRHWSRFVSPIRAGSCRAGPGRHAPALLATRPGSESNTDETPAPQFSSRAAKLLNISSTVCIAIALGCGAGCRNAGGERISFGEWWHNRGDTARKANADAPAVSTDHRADADATTGHHTDANAPTDHHAEVGGPAAADAAQDTDQPDDVSHGGSARISPDAIHSNALIVNDETISVDDILEPILPRIEQLAGTLSPRAYYQQVGDLVRQRIIEAVAQSLIWRRAQESIEEGAEPRIDKAVDKVEKDRITREFNGSETRYEKYLTQRGKLRSEVRERLRRELIINGYLRDYLLPLVRSPRRQELRQYYDAHMDEFSKAARREMFLIDVPIRAFIDPRKPSTQTGWTAAQTKARQTIEDAAEALTAGDSFQDVVGKHSHGLHKKDGGGWGFIREPLQGRWAAPSKRLFEMKPSEVSEIIEAADSFFIVKVGQVEVGECVSFQDAQPSISNSLKQQRFAELRAEFLQKELKQSTLGSLDAFVTEVLKSIPPPAGS